MKNDSELIPLQLYIDEDELLRCHGRLRYIDFLSYEARYPIPLARKGRTGLQSRLSKFIMERITMEVAQN